MQFETGEGSKRSAGWGARADGFCTRIERVVVQLAHPAFSLSLSLSALHLTLRKGKRENFVKKLRMCHASTFMTVCDTVLHYGPGKRQLNTLKAPPQLGLGAVTVTVLGNFHFLFFTPYYIT